MTENENVDYVVSIEKKYPVENWMVNGQHIWPLVRSEIINYNRKHYRIANKKQPNIYHQLLSNIKAMLRFPMYDLCNKEQKEVLVLHDNLDRSILLENGTFYDKILDSIYDLLQQNDISVLNIEEPMQGNNKPYGNVVTFEFIILVIRVFNKLFTENGKVSLDQYTDFLNDIPLDLSAKLSVKEVQHHVGLINRISKFMEMILKKHNTKLVIFECWYDTYRYALSMACKRIGIKAVDVQHGRAGATGQEYYSKWTKFPENSNYEIMPDVFWTWTESDKKAIDAWHTDKIIAYNGGKPIFSTLNQLKNIADISAIKKIDKSKPIILFSVQPENVYPNWLVQFIKESSNDYTWLLRYHLPVDDMQKLFVDEFANIPNVYVDGMESVLLEILLNECNIHVTMSSSVVVDAAMMNKPSIIMNKNFIGTFDEYLSNGMCSFADNVYELENAIKKGLQKSAHCSNLWYVEKNNANIEFIKSLME